MIDDINLHYSFSDLIDRAKEAAKSPPRYSTISITKRNLLRIIDAYESTQRRLNFLLSLQTKFRDPERTILIDIIANGQLLPDPEGKRYGTHQVTVSDLSTKVALKKD